jgi:hypothetical protein
MSKSTKKSKLLRVPANAEAVKTFLEAGQQEPKLPAPAYLRASKIKVFKFGLGDFVRDRLTKIEGYVVTRTDHLTGCTQITITCGSGADTKYAPIDEDRLELVAEVAPFILGPITNNGPSDSPITSMTTSMFEAK